MYTGITFCVLAALSCLACYICNIYAGNDWIDERGFHHDYVNAEGWMMLFLCLTPVFAGAACGAFLSAWLE